MTDLGSYITKLREAKGWSQRELARRMQFSSTSIQRIENGETDPNIGTLVAIAEALKVSESKLILAWKGKDPDADIEDYGKQIESAAIEFASHLPDRLLLEALNSRPYQEVFEKLVKAKGKEKMKGLVQKAIQEKEAEENQ